MKNSLKLSLALAAIAMAVAGSTELVFRARRWRSKYYELAGLSAASSGIEAAIITTGRAAVVHPSAQVATSASALTWPTTRTHPATRTGHVRESPAPANRTCDGHAKIDAIVPMATSIVAISYSKSRTALRSRTSHATKSHNRAIERSAFSSVR